jgi:hypothetical protein
MLKSLNSLVSTVVGTQVFLAYSTDSGVSVVEVEETENYLLQTIGEPYELISGLNEPTYLTYCAHTQELYLCEAGAR